MQEEPTTPQPRPAAPANRRVRPLSQTRSYHSIFSSLRGSVRNTVNRGSSRGRAQDREDEEEEEEEEETIPTTPPPIEETTTMEVVLETKAPENNISPESEDDVGYDEEPLTTKTPSLKVLTPSSTKASTRLNVPPRRPIKIRVHQKPRIKTASSSSSTSSSSSSSATSSTSSSSSDSLSSSFPSTSSSSSSPSPSTTSVSTSSHIQESAASRKDYVTSTYPESKNTYDKPSRTYTKPSTPVVKYTNSQQTKATSVGKGSASTGRTNGSGFGSRYGYSRRHPGILLRGNSTRILNGYKPAVTSQSNLPRTPNQATSNTRGSDTSQSTLPDRTQNHKTSHTFNSSTSRSPSQSETHSQENSDSYNFDKSRSTLESKSHGSTTSQTSQSSSNHPSTINTSGSSQSTSHRGSHSPATSHNEHNTQSSHTSSERDTTIRERNDDSYYKNTDAEVTTVEEPTSSSKPQPTEQVKREEEDREESSNEKPVFTRTRVSPSFAERFPWLASRYPGRFGSGTRVSSSRQDGRTSSTRTSSSMGASTPVLRGTTTRISGATGTTGVSRIQETSEDLRNSSTHDSLKNGVGMGSVKPSLTNQNTASSDPRNPATSSSSFSTSKPTPHHSSTRQGESREPIHRETSNNNKNDNKDYLNERSRENNGKNDKVADPTSAQKNPIITSADPHRNLEENQSVDTSSRTRSGSTSQTSQTHVRPGVGMNGRVHPPLLANRQFGGSRLPIRTQLKENSRLGYSASHSPSSSTDSSSSKVQQPVLTSDRGIGSGTTVTKTGGLIGGNSQSILSSSASSSSSRDSFRGQGGRTRYPSLRGKPTNGRQFKPANGNGKVHR